ncbi:methyltransferase [Wenyingzhuangia sp. IMCC45574]
MYKKMPNRRYEHTLSFLQKVLPAPATILDIGVRNPFSEIMEENGYTVYNTTGEDLDEFPEVVNKYNVDAVTSFEVFEHLLSPYELLKLVEAKKLITTIPLRLWFATAYRSKTDKWDRHYHEFEDWQFDWLLEKTNWEIKIREKWTSPIKQIGFRPLLRTFTPRYYAVYAERK